MFREYATMHFIDPLPNFNETVNPERNTLEKP